MEICFVGDIMLGRLVNDRLRRTGPGHPWGDVLPVLAGADVRIGNLECVLSDRGIPWPGKTFHFRSDTRNVACLEAAGFDAVSLANNHVLDYDADALLDTLCTLDAHRVLHAGAGADLDAARRPALWECRGTRLGLVALTDNEPGWEATGRAPGVHHVPIDPADARARALLEAVRDLRERTGVLIVSAHWGGNWGTAAPPAHRAFAHALIDAGADVVYGHSPHITRGIEIHRGRPILYGTGDFVDDYAVDPLERNDESFIFLLRTGGEGPGNRQHQAGELQLVPTVIEDCSARLAGPGDAARMVRRMQRLCADLGTASTWREDLGRLVVPLVPHDAGAPADAPRTPPFA
ncbi:hypothetical protein GCM10023081_02780 [Arthrobacter ginkgonis]|uniref:Capsule synthesis protein CapA domain-containing protein n=1 Tax=Arthrobacter ginkgonis TaxID=1630594 RepID=A0ABP7BSM8_9MICC